MNHTNGPSNSARTPTPPSSPPPFAAANPPRQSPSSIPSASPGEPSVTSPTDPTKRWPSVHYSAVNAPPSPTTPHHGHAHANSALVKRLEGASATREESKLFPSSSSPFMTSPLAGEVSSSLTTTPTQAIHDSRRSSTPSGKQQEGEAQRQPLTPTTISSYDLTTLRQKLTEANTLIARLTDALTDARTKAAHYTFQHKLLTIEAGEAKQRHQVEKDIAKREVEALRNDQKHHNQQLNRAVRGGVGAGAAAGVVPSLNNPSIAHQGDQPTAHINHTLHPTSELPAELSTFRLYRKKLKRAKLTLLDNKEEIAELKAENERLKKRIRENRAHRNGGYGGGHWERQQQYGEEGESIGMGRRRGGRVQGIQSSPGYKGCDGLGGHGLDDEYIHPPPQQTQLRRGPLGISLGMSSDHQARQARQAQAQHLHQQHDPLPSTPRTPQATATSIDRTNTNAAIPTLTRTSTNHSHYSSHSHHHPQTPSRQADSENGLAALGFLATQVLSQSQSQPQSQGHSQDQELPPTQIISSTPTPTLRTPNASKTTIPETPTTIIRHQPPESNQRSAIRPVSQSHTPSLSLSTPRKRPLPRDRDGDGEENNDGNATFSGPPGTPTTDMTLHAHPEVQVAQTPPQLPITTPSQYHSSTHLQPPPTPPNRQHTHKRPRLLPPDSNNNPNSSPLLDSSPSGYSNVSLSLSPTILLTGDSSPVSTSPRSIRSISPVYIPPTGGSISHSYMSSPVVPLLPASAREYLASASRESRGGRRGGGLAVRSPNVQSPYYRPAQAQAVQQVQATRSVNPHLHHVHHHHLHPVPDGAIQQGSPLEHEDDEPLLPPPLSHPPRPLPNQVQLQLQLSPNEEAEFQRLAREDTPTPSSPPASSSRGLYSSSPAPVGSSGVRKGKGRRYEYNRRTKGVGGGSGSGRG